MAYNKPPINLDFRRVNSSKIALVGIELEGGWAKIPEGITLVEHNHPQPGQIGRDGSLRTLRDRLSVEAIPVVGELPSPPIKEADIDTWLDKHYPTEVGPECGLHVHLSFANALNYMRLMDDEAYASTVVEYIKRWAEKEEFPKDSPIWDRLAGKCVYCQHVFWPAEQIKNYDKDYNKERKGHRYTALNFCYGRDGLGTIECRLMSMPSTVDAAKRGVKEFISITNRYLVATAKRERKKVATVVVDQPAYELSLSSNI